MLKNAGFPAQFIVDQGRSGQQNLRQQWGDWCNIKGAGFGTRPTTSTGSSLIDSIVWVKPGGECDGTSNSSSPRYDSTCSLVSATSAPAYRSFLTLSPLSPMLSSPPLRLVPGSRHTSRPSSQRPTHHSKHRFECAKSLALPRCGPELVPLSCTSVMCAVLYSYSKGLSSPTLSKAC